MEKPRAVIFIDGNNFYFRLKDLTVSLPGRIRLLDFNYRSFAAWLVGESALVEVRYYIGALKRQPGNGKSEELYASQQKLFAHLQRQDIVLRLGQLIRHDDKSFHEKGVDVRLAVEMIRLARENRYDMAYLLSSDTDLVAAVEEVQSFGKKVQYVGVAKHQSFGLTKVASDVRILRPEDIKPFLSLTLL